MSSFKFNRRSFFLLSSMGIIVGGGACGSKLYGQLVEVNEDFRQSQKLGLIERQNLSGLYNVMTGVNAETDEKTIAETMDFFGAFLAQIPLPRRRELNLGLKALDILPFFFMFSFLPFRKMELKQQVLFLEKLSKGPAVLYPLFSSLKELVYLAYYRLPQNYQKLEYYGPVAKSDGPIEEHQKFYQALKAQL